jgi:hypothetical protein
MTEPTAPQLQSLYIRCYWLTNIAFQPIHIIRLDERTGNLFVLAGSEESIELEINPNGELLP